MQAALRDAQACVRLSPTWAKGHMRLGGAHLATGKPRDAYAAFAAAVTHTRKRTTPHPFLTFFLHYTSLQVDLLSYCQHLFFCAQCCFRVDVSSPCSPRL